jgi:hypothetical protein
MIVLVASWRGVVGFFGSARFRELTPDLLRRLRLILVAVVATLLIGHGALGLEGKPGLVANYAAVMPMDLAVRATALIGGAEIGLALALARWPSVPLALFIAMWKLGTESLFVAAGQPVWEIVERGGSYAVPVALAIVLLLAARTHDVVRPHT